MPDVNDELESLRRENARLRRLLKLTNAEAAPAIGAQAAWFDKSPGSVDANSSPQAKVRFYAALFGARTDVYAIRWENARSGKSGWMPVVEGGWRKGSKAADHRYLPLTPEVLTAHLTGDIHIGLYPMLPGDQTCWVTVDPTGMFGSALPGLRRPQFLAIVSANVLATYLARDEATRPDGFVIEGPRAGGHNAPPRGTVVLDERNQPVYGPRDEVDLDKLGALGIPFWLAGGQGTPERLVEARSRGAAGVQVGTLFALAQDSGLSQHLRRQLLGQLAAGALDVRTDPRASPTGFPFKVAEVAGTLTEHQVYEGRQRLCDLSYLRTPYQTATGDIGYRCPGEPAHMYVRKGGDLADTVGRACLCNALTADVGLAQTRVDGYVEPPLVTLGSDVAGAEHLAATHPEGWTAADAIAWLTGA